MILIYSPKKTSRLIFACEFIFSTVLKLPYEITTVNNKTETNFFKLNYSNENNNGLQIIPSGLLAQSGIQKINISVFNFKNSPVIFPAAYGDFPFDIFSMVFYFLSRYEEYQDFITDEHSRFPATESLAFKNNFLDFPVIDKAIRNFGNWLQERHGNLKIESPSFGYHSTIDIDNAYFLKGKATKRILGSMVKSFLKGNFSETKRRINVWKDDVSDPFDTYDFQIGLAKKFNVPLTYFILYATNSEFDRSLEPGNSTFHELINKITSNAEIGIHPSYFSYDDDLKLRDEIKSLSQISGKVSKSRQHFLRLRFPNTPKLLLQNGIKMDFSMGYSTHNGFRAGTSYPFPYYDFEKESSTDLIFVPFQIMDSVFYDKKKLSAKDAWYEIERFREEVKLSGGTFISVWHDRAFDEVQYPGWKDCYEKLHSNR